MSTRSGILNEGGGGRGRNERDSYKWMVGLGRKGCEFIWEHVGLKQSLGNFF